MTVKTFETEIKRNAKNIDKLTRLSIFQMMNRHNISGGRQEDKVMKILTKYGYKIKGNLI
jgi:hypothetical protein